MMGMFVVWGNATPQDKERITRLLQSLDHGWIEVEEGTDEEDEIRRDVINQYDARGVVWADPLVVEKDADGVVIWADENPLSYQIRLLSGKVES